MGYCEKKVLLGRRKNGHKLAIEDLINTRNRTKVEWNAMH
jgi:hypothetical protein